MASFPTFANAPITEAILDIQTSRVDGFDFRALDPFCTAIAEGYPNKRLRKAWRAEFSWAEDGASSASEAETDVVGYLMTSADGTLIAQARVNGFSLSRLRPYDNWDSLRNEARRLWNIYTDSVSPLGVERIALRYVNRLELPSPIGDLREYLQTVPLVAPELPQSLDGFLMQLHIPSKQHGALAIVTESIEGSTNNGETLPVILDIDAVHNGHFQSRDAAMWIQFESLHELKNEIFFHSVTDKAKELFK